MKSKEKLHTLLPLSTILALFLILVSLTALVVFTEQSASSTGSRAYVTSYCGCTVSVIDTTKNEIIATIEVIRPVGVAISPDETKVYVTTEYGAVS